jgi:hypothetical protein
MTDHGCKLCRVLAEREMADYEGQLVDQWHGETGQRKGYRKLAEWFNVTLLRREMDKAGLSTLGDEAESKYERLQGDGTVAEEVRQILRRNGLPIEQIEADFVAYGVVRKHLTECLGEEYNQESSDWERDAIDRARSHASKKITEAVRAAVSNGKLNAEGNISVDISVELTCDETHVSVPIEQAFRRGYVSNDDPDDASTNSLSSESSTASETSGEPQ